MSDFQTFLIVINLSVLILPVPLWIPAADADLISCHTKPCGNGSSKVTTTNNSNLLVISILPVVLYTTVTVIILLNVYCCDCTLLSNFLSTPLKYTL